MENTLGYMHDTDYSAQTEVSRLDREIALMQNALPLQVALTAIVVSACAPLYDSECVKDNSGDTDELVSL